MSKKFKILMLSLVLLSGSTINNNYFAAGVNEQNPGFFESIGDFFSNLFGFDEPEYADALYQGQTTEPTSAIIDPDVGNYATNIAYGEDGDGSTDQGTGIIELEGGMVGTVSTKQIQYDGTHTCDTTPGVDDDLVPCIGIGEEAKMIIEGHNTGNVDDVTFTITDPVNTFSTFIYDDGASVTLNTEGDTDGDMVFNTATSAPTIADLRGSGVKVDGVDSGEYFKLEFPVRALATSSIDYYMHNEARVCQPYDSATNKIHLNEYDLADGEVIGTELCDFPSADFMVDGDGDSEFTLPEISWLSSSKRVVDTGRNADDTAAAGTINSVAEPGEALQFQITLRNIGTEDKTVIVTDDFTKHPSLSNVYFDTTQNLKETDGTTDFMPDGSTIYTLGDLNAGISFTIPQGVRYTFTFKGVVNDPITTSTLEEGALIKNTATICDDADASGVAESGETCVDKDASITTNSFASAIDLEKDVTLFKEDGTEDTGSHVVDTTSVASGDASKKPTIHYDIAITNTSSTDLTGLTLDDVLPSRTYLSIAMDGTVTVDIVDAGVTGNTALVTTPAGTNLVVSELATGVEINVGAGDTITFAFDITLADTIYDAGWAIVGESPVFTNKAELTDGTTTIKNSDWATLDPSVTGPADGSFDVTKDHDDATYLTDGENAGNAAGAVDAGDTVTYSVDITNNGDVPAVYTIYDPFSDSSFDVTTAGLASLNATVSNGTFVTDLTGATAATPSDSVSLESLMDSSANTYLAVGSGQTATLTISIVLDDDVPTLTDDPSDILINDFYVCTSDADFSGLTAIEADANCATDSDEIALSDAPLIYVTKTIDDQNATAGTDGVAEIGETLDFTITVKNSSTSDRAFDYILTDYLVDPNVVINPAAEVSVDFDSDSTVDVTVTLGDLLAGYNAREVAGTKLAKGQVDTYTYSLDTNWTDGGTPADLTDDTFANPDAQFIYNGAAAKIAATTREGLPIEYPTIAKIPVAGGAAESVDRFDAQKIMVEKDETLATTEIDKDDVIEVTFLIANTSVDGDGNPIDGVVKLKETLELDPNIDWAGSQTNALTVNSLSGNAGFATDYSSTEADLGSGVTVANLVDTTSGTPALGSGAYLFVPADETVAVSFELNVVDGTTSEPWTSSATVDNTLTYCQEGSITDKCDTADAAIPTVGFEALDVTKTVTNSIDSLGNVNNAGSATPVDKTDDYYYGTDGGNVTYEVVIDNTGTKDFDSTSGFVFSDIVDPSSYFDYTIGTSNVIVAAEEYSSYTPYDVTNSTTTGTGVSDTTTPNSSTTLTLATLNGESGTPVTLANPFEAGHSLVLTFTLTLETNLNEFLTTNATIPNVAKACFNSEGYYIEGGGTGQVCVQGSNELPYQKDGETVTDPDDPDFSIVKDIAEDNDVLEPGETTKMNIEITNNDIDNSGNSKDILLTDELIDGNFKYADILESNIIIADTTAVPGGSSSFGVKYATEEEFIADNTLLNSERDPATDAVKVKNLLPNTGEFVDVNGDTLWPETTVPNDQRGGVWLRIPANHTYTVSFDVSAQGDLKMITRVKDFFDVKKYFE